MGRLIRPLVSLCSANEAKLQEVRDVLPGLQIELLAVEYPPEDGATYVDNARIKARHGRAVGPRERWMLADDSGLELAALGGAPGVHTARWAAGRHVERALSALEGTSDRRARYVCELVCLSPDGDELAGTGVLEGSIAESPAGSGRLRVRPGVRPGRREPDRRGARGRLEGGALAPRARGRRAHCGASASPGGARRATHQLTSAPITITFAIT